jgi:carboxypeptidase D
VLETWPQIIGYDVEVLKWFQEQNHLCGYDINLTYPQEHKIPSLEFHSGGGALHILKRDVEERVQERHESIRSLGILKRDQAREEARQQWKRDLSQRMNGTIDPWYGCSLLAEAVDYAVNYTWPWNAGDGSTFDASFYFCLLVGLSSSPPQLYEVPSVLKPSFFADASVFLNGMKLISRIPLFLTRSSRRNC